MNLIHAIASKMYRSVKPVRDAAYMAYIRQFPCIGCGTTRRPREAMHIGPHGMGQKASDLDTLPGCHLCHVELHAIGSKNWQRKHRVDFRERIEFFQYLYSVEFPERTNQEAA